jgi:hypothetical protein
VVRFTVKYIAVCERILGGIFALYAIGGFVFGFFPTGTSRAISIPVGCVVLVIMGGPAILCFKSAKAIIEGARWAWFTSLIISMFPAVIGCGALTYAFSPQTAQEGHHVLMSFLGAIFLVPSVAGLVLLNLPQMRKFVFRSSSERSLERGLQPTG